MRGFPLINAGVILLALVLACVPLVGLTRSGNTEVVISDEPVEQSSQIPVSLTVRYAHEPSQLTVSHLGRVLWEAASGEALARGQEARLAIAPEGIDLVVNAIWPEGTPETALELQVEPEALAGQSKVLWGEGEIDDVMTFVWEEIDS